MDQISKEEIQEIARISAEAGARAAIKDFLELYGFDIENKRDMREDMAYLRKSRIGSEQAITWIKRSAITAFIAGTTFALWQGIKHYIHIGS